MPRAYPPYVMVVNSERALRSLAAGRKRRHSDRLPGDGGPPRWAWGPMTRLTLEGLTRKPRTQPYSVAFVGWCEYCGDAHQIVCPGCQTNGIITEVVVVDPGAQPTQARELCDLEEYRRLAKNHSAAESQRRRRK